MEKLLPLLGPPYAKERMLCRTQHLECIGKRASPRRGFMLTRASTGRHAPHAIKYPKPTYERYLRNDPGVRENERLREAYCSTRSTLSTPLFTFSSR